MIVLVLPYPVSANVYWRTRVFWDAKAGGSRVQTYVSPEAKNYREAVLWTARGAGIREPIAGRVELGYRLYPHRPLDYLTRMRKHGELWDDDVMCMDLANAEKVMSDALQGIVIVNDRQIRKLVGERMEPDEHGARLVVYIRPVVLLQADLLCDQPTTPARLPCSPSEPNSTSSEAPSSMPF